MEGETGAKGEVAAGVEGDSPKTTTEAAGKAPRGETGHGGPRGASQGARSMLNRRHLLLLFHTAFDLREELVLDVGGVDFDGT